MMQLGTDKYASEMRARMMSASLLSDMESFKVRIICTIFKLDDRILQLMPIYLSYNAGGKSWCGLGGLYSMVLAERLDRR